MTYSHCPTTRPRPRQIPTIQRDSALVSASVQCKRLSICLLAGHCDDALILPLGEKRVCPGIIAMKLQNGFLQLTVHIKIIKSSHVTARGVSPAVISESYPCPGPIGEGGTGVGRYPIQSWSCPGVPLLDRGVPPPLDLDLDLGYLPSPALNLNHGVLPSPCERTNKLKTLPGIWAFETDFRNETNV